LTYIGLSPPNTFTKSTSQTFTGNGSTTAFTLQTRVSSPEDLEVFVSNVQQQPTESYTISSDGVTMTFSEAPPSGTFYVIYRTVAQQAGTDTGASRLGENNTFTGTNTFTGDVTFDSTNSSAYDVSWDSSEGKLRFNDSAKLELGTDGDAFMRANHVGTVFYAESNFFYFNNTKENGDIGFFTDDGSGGLATYIKCDGGDGEVNLYHYGSEKFATKSTGVEVTGTLDMNGGEVILDADADTSITADTDDQIDIRVAGSDKVKIDATKFEISGTTANTQGGEFPRIQISTLADNNPTYSGALDIVEKQSGASSTAVFGSSAIYGFRMMLDGFNNVLKWFSGSQTTVTERMGLDRDTGNLTLNTGNLIIGTAGKGIDFSATSDGTTSTSEVLDDYEEGNWNATLTPQTSGSVNVSNDGCQYVKIGQIVHVSGIVQVNSVSSPTGVMRMGGFPFACANLDDLSGGVLATINIQACATPPHRYGMWMQEGDSTADIFNFITSSDQPQGSASQNFGGNESIYFSLTYRTT